MKAYATESPPALKAQTQGFVVGYIVSRFPKISETFILREILALEDRNFRVELFPMVVVREERIHPEAHRLNKAAHRVGYFSIAIVKAQFHWFQRKPVTYFLLWAEVIAGHIFSPKFLIRSLALLPKAAWMAQQAQVLGCGHMHAHFATHAALAGHVVHKLTGIPYSFTAHAHDIYVERPMLGRKMKAANFIVTISQFNRIYLQKLFGQDAASKTRVIHCGVDTESYSPMPSRSSKDGVSRLVCIASLEEYKGHVYLVKACSLLARQGLRFRCGLIGGGVLERKLKELVHAEGLTDHIHFHGRLPQAEVREILAVSDLLVLPSVITSRGKMEGLPVVLMEAMALETPVVTTGISGIPELVRHEKTGILVPEKDVEALAAGIRRQLENPEQAAAMARAGRRLVIQEFDLRKNADEIAALFRDSMVSAC